MFYQLRQGLSKLLSITGGINYFWNKLPNGVYAFNYHRIGDKSQTPFDRAIFSCTEKAFEEQVLLLKSHFTVINTIELAELIKSDKIVSGRFAVITFDDGYLDNYTNALPILLKHNVPAVFYLATEFLSVNQITWWDEVAYLLRHSKEMTYQLPKAIRQYQLDECDIDKSIQLIMTDIKQTKTISVLEALDDIRAKFPLAKQKLLSEEHKLFMGWKEAHGLVAKGMEIGSHTLTHPILSQLDNKQHQDEVIESKRILEETLQCKINSIAYPVGRYYCYNEKTFKFAESAGYQIGFNNEPGFHRSIYHNLDINRFCVATNDLNYLKYECCFI